jgi:hypothetical protein
VSRARAIGEGNILFWTGKGSLLILIEQAIFTVLVYAQRQCAAVLFRLCV